MAYAVASRLNLYAGFVIAPSYVLRSYDISFREKKTRGGTLRAVCWATLRQQTHSSAAYDFRSLRTKPPSFSFHSSECMQPTQASTSKRSPAVSPVSMD